MRLLYLGEITVLTWRTRGLIIFVHIAFLELGSGSDGVDVLPSRHHVGVAAVEAVVVERSVVEGVPASAGKSVGQVVHRTVVDVDRLLLEDRPQGLRHSAG